MKKLRLLVMPLMAISLLASCAKNRSDQFNMNDEACVNYLSATTSQSQFDTIFYNISSRTGVRHDISLPYFMSCDPDGGNEYYFHIANNAEFKDEEVITALVPKMYYDNLIPGQQYFWKINSSKTDKILKSGHFTVNKDNVRWINAPSVGNMRDLGGWDLPDGKQIKFGKLYRGRNPDFINLDDQKMLKDVLDIKTQIDLRKDTDGNPPPSKKPFADGIKYYYYNDNLTYADIITKIDDKLPGKCIIEGEEKDPITGAEMFKDIFDRLANPDNYPIYFHCSAGADRTGALAFMIEALLGVSYDDIVRDYELTSFSPHIVGGRLRCNPNEQFTDFDYSTDCYTTYDKWPEEGYKPKWPRLINKLKEIDGNLSIAVTTFLKDRCHISQETLDQVKANLTE
ncbi:MAG: tyrosine-protein phosphatase [Bacilli bacterium]|nr:tyrosine-protein phosphatase [Bacilli bacterium]